MPSRVSGDIWTVAYHVNVRNIGDVDLTMSSLLDDLTLTLTAPASLVGALSILDIGSTESASGRLKRVVWLLVKPI